MQGTFASMDLGFCTVSCHSCYTDCFDNASEAGNVFSHHSALSRVHMQSYKGGFICGSVIISDLIFKEVLALLDAPEED